MDSLETQIREFHEMLRKSLAGPGPVKVRKGKAGRPSRVEGKDRTLLYVASDETADRYGDIIRVKGWTLENFAKAPVFIWSHNYELPPIGTVRAFKEKDPKALMSEVTYFPRERSEFAESIYLLAEIGGIPGVSVGFMPVTFNDPTDAAEREKLGLGQFGFEFTGADLLELSQVSVPANPNAVGASYESPEQFAQGLGKALASSDPGAFGKDQARVFVRDAGDWFAAAATPVLRDLSLLPSAPLISIPAAATTTNNVTAAPATMNVGTASNGIGDVVTITSTGDPLVPLANGHVYVSPCDYEVKIDIGAEISKAVKAACEQVAKSITDSLTSEPFLRSLHDAVRSATAGHATKAAPKPEPPVQSQVVASILESGLKERLEKDRMEKLEKLAKALKK